MSCELGETSGQTCKRGPDGVCVVEGEPVHWPSACLDYAIQLDGSPRSRWEADQLLPVFEDAFALWKSADCGSGRHPHFEVNFQGFVSCDRHQAVCGTAKENVNVFMFSDREWPSSLPATAIAVTIPRGAISSGQLIDADIRFNSANYSFDPGVPGSFELSRVVAHELGHFLGLSHSNQSGALMSVDYHKLSTAGVLFTADDQAAVCAAFPPEGEPLNCPATTPATDACAVEEIGKEKPCKLPSSTAAGGCSLAGPPEGRALLGFPLLLGSAIALLTSRRRRSGIVPELVRRQLHERRRWQLHKGRAGSSGRSVHGIKRGKKPRSSWA